MRTQVRHPKQKPSLVAVDCMSLSEWNYASKNSQACTLLCWVFTDPFAWDFGGGSEVKAQMLWSHPPLETDRVLLILTLLTRPLAITSVWNLLINSDLWPGTPSFSVTAQREVSWKTNYLPQMPNSAHSAAGSSWICSERTLLSMKANRGLGNDVCLDTKITSFSVVFAH